MTKEEVRKVVKKRKQAMTRQEIEQKSKKIHENLRENKEYQCAETIYIYLSYNEEVNTNGIIQESFELGKQIVVPKVQQKTMNFYEIHSLDEVAKGFCNIPEPVVSTKPVEKKGLMIMPGLAFDKNGNRVGYGGGFYDRFLQRFPKDFFYKIALVYENQMFEQLEVEAFDYQVDQIITEKTYYNIR